VDLVVAEIRRRLEYDPQTGLLTWRATGRRAGGLKQTGYIGITLCFQGRQFKLLAHRVAFVLMLGRFPLPGLQVDHINRNPVDNRWANLREVTPAANRHNSPHFRGDPTHLVGTRASGKRFSAYIKTAGRQIHLGVFATRAEAHGAYVAAAERVAQRVEA
jgi:hypothetical protein